MIKRSTRSIAALAVVVVAVMLTSCSSDSSQPKEADLASSAKLRARVIVAQIGVDTGHIDLSHLVEGVLVNGIVTESLGFDAWHVTGQNLNVAGSGSPRISDEEAKATAVLRQLPNLQSDQDRKHHVPTLTPDQAARLLIAHQLQDSGVDVPTSAVDEWFTAHADQPLAPGATVTLGTEASRVVAEITKPQP